MKTKTILLTLLIINLFAGQVSAQTFTPEVGKQLPDYTFTDVVNNPTKRNNMHSFKGKWLILDFWATTCGACIGSFPKMSKLSEQFKDQVQLIMIGAHTGNKGHNTEARTKRLYNLLKEKYNLKFTVAFDSLLSANYAIQSLPYILIVDPNGVIQGITEGVTDDIVREFVKGGHPALKKSYTALQVEAQKAKYNFKQPVLTNGIPANGGNDTSFVYRSLLGEYQDGVSPAQSGRDLITNKSIIKSGRLGLWQDSRLDVDQMYMLAYIGTSNIDFPLLPKDLKNNYWPVPIHEFKDSSLNDICKTNENTDQGFYNYSLSVPLKRAKLEYMRHILKSDLKNIFGFEAEIVSRKMPVWKLIVIDSNKVKTMKTKGGKLYYETTNMPRFEGIDATNTDIETLLGLLRTPIEYTEKFRTGIFPGSRLRMVNETNLNYNLDFKLKALMTDLKIVKNALREKGLDLVQGEKEMKVLIISDGQQF